MCVSKNAPPLFVGFFDERSESKIRGMTLAGAYCDEITLFPESFVAMLLSRLSIPRARLYATANPDAPAHYIKKKYIDNPNIDLTHWKFLLEDNIFLDKEYIKQIKRENTGIFYDRYILGLWKQAEGSIYREFIENETEFYVTRQYAGKHRFGYLNIGVDWGGNKSGHAFVATGVTYDFNRVIILRSEWHKATGTTPDMVIDRLIKFIGEIERDYTRPSAIYADSAEQLMINLLRQKTRLPVYNSLKRQIIDRIRFTTSLMAARRLLLTEECQTVADFFKNAAYDEKSADDKRLDDGSYDVDSGDAFEYSIERYMDYIVVNS